MNQNTGDQVSMRIDRTANTKAAQHRDAEPDFIGPPVCGFSHVNKHPMPDARGVCLLDFLLRCYKRIVCYLLMTEVPNSSMIYNLCVAVMDAVEK